MSNAATSHPTVRRREAGEFLRSRRGRLAPCEVGLPPGFRRRTPGLRREEVAMLAGVGTTWYTWLEQGREISPSSEVLSAIAGVLRLDSAERQHLFSLYDRSTPERGVAETEYLGEPLRRMLEALAGQPAFVLGWRWDILGWNKAAEALIGPYQKRDGERLNTLELLFSNTAHRALFVDWETVARGALATFRAACTPYIGDPQLDDLVSRLQRLSPEFAAWWPEHDVALHLSGTKRLNHPTAGRMNFHFSMLAVGDQPGVKLFVFTAVEEEDTSRKLMRLLEQSSPVALAQNGA